MTDENKQVLWVKKVLSFLIPLPPVHARREMVVPVWWINSGLDLRKDFDYLVYRLFVVMAGVGTLVLAMMLIDVNTGTDFLINAAMFERENILFPVAFRDAMIVPYIVVLFSFYLRIRFFINIKEVKISFYKKKAYVDWIRSWSRRKWIIQSVLMTIVGTVLITLGSHIYVVRLTLHYGMQDSFPFIFVLVLTQLIAIAFAAFVAVVYAISLEKALRFYPELKSQLEQLSEDVSRREK